MLKKKNQSFSILIPDGEQDLLTGQVLQCLSEAPHVKCYVMSNKKYLSSRFSRYTQHYSFYPETEDINIWIENINTEVDKYEIQLIMPIYEVGIKNLIQHKKKIKNTVRIVALPSLESFKTARNKVFLAKHLIEYNIPSPKIFHLKSKKGFSREQFEFPMIAKPLNESEGGEGIRLFENWTDFETFYNNGSPIEGLLFQKYVKGYDIDCSVLCKNGQIMAFTIQKGNFYGKKKFAPASGLQFLFEPKLFEVVTKLMKTLNWTGVAHVDLRYDYGDGEFKVIEVNTRFWTSLDASLIAGVNFPYLYTLLSLNKDFTVPKYNYISTLNLDGLLNKINQNKMFLTKIRFILNNTSLKFVVKDPLPLLFKLFSRLKYFIVKK